MFRTFFLKFNDAVFPRGFEFHFVSTFQFSGFCVYLDSWSINGFKVFGSDHVSDNQCFIRYDIIFRFLWRVASVNNQLLKLNNSIA